MRNVIIGADGGGTKTNLVALDAATGRKVATAATGSINVYFAGMEEAVANMKAALAALERVGFREVNGVPYLAHTVSSCGSFLAKEAGVSPGSALAYLIAPPLESMAALDAALKAVDVKLCKLYAPPTETNFGGALLSGTRSACAAACDAFAGAVAAIAQQPIER